MGRHSYADKVALVQNYTDTEKTVKEVAQEAHVALETAYNWLRSWQQYQEVGIDGPLPFERFPKDGPLPPKKGELVEEISVVASRGQAHYPTAFKERVVLEHLAGETMRVVAKRHSLSLVTVSAWVHEYRDALVEKRKPFGRGSWPYGRKPGSKPTRGIRQVGAPRSRYRKTDDAQYRAEAVRAYEMGRTLRSTVRLFRISERELLMWLGEASIGVRPEIRPAVWLRLPEQALLRDQIRWWLTEGHLTYQAAARKFKIPGKAIKAALEAISDGT